MNTKGFSLIEVLIAITVLGIGLLGIISMQTSATGGKSLSRTITEASTFSANQLESLISLPYTDANLLDTNGDGNLGLNHPFPALPLLPGQAIPDGNFIAAPALVVLAPDHQVTSTDGNYTICWNVSVNYPIPNLKTIRVIVISSGRGVQKVVNFDFIKADTI
ncbi:MAG: prepilin-type N-terminal cleavage/methylation domain-containing protein [Proteobacteria bacterium]|nr:prepilin-type N-terminal cleavage/methylation domain-containing protein [Desulfobulbaceae bacterium]MBU4153341.1 prepilin-type N-terminal cleavage/methylation domain-containing protein [Pseudomonadota bacterium]MDP2106983.1 prepilin-type N-terminal cleavage/methylation domain-containing protein [Desulfobulbaceae bacterium]